MGMFGGFFLEACFALSMYSFCYLFIFSLPQFCSLVSITGGYLGYLSWILGWGGLFGWKGSMVDLFMGYKG